MSYDKFFKRYTFGSQLNAMLPDERERFTILLRFGLYREHLCSNCESQEASGRMHTLDDIGEQLTHVGLSPSGMTRERVRQIEAKALRKLRTPGMFSKEQAETWTAWAPKLMDAIGAIKEYAEGTIHDIKQKDRWHEYSRLLDEPTKTVEERLIEIANSPGHSPDDFTCEGHMEDEIYFDLDAAGILHKRIRELSGFTCPLCEYLESHSEVSLPKQVENVSSGIFINFDGGVV